MSVISKVENPRWNTKVKENVLANKGIWASKKFAGNFAVAVTAGIISSIFWKIYCHTLSSCQVTSLSSTVFLGALVSVSYNIFNERESLYLAVRKYLNHNNAFIELAKNEIKNELVSKMGEIWLRNKSLTLKEGIHHFLQICLTDEDTCDGQVLAFLDIIHNSEVASLGDSDVEYRLKEIKFIKYQMMRELKIEVKNQCLRDLVSSSFNQGKISELALFGFKDPLLDYCKQYDPYTLFDNYCIYEGSVNKRDIDKIFKDIQDRVCENLKNQKDVLVGRINYSDQGEDQAKDHSIAVQFNFEHYRYRNHRTIVSFTSVEKLLDNLYQLSDSFNTRDGIEVRLWKLPYQTSSTA